MTGEQARAVNGSANDGSSHAAPSRTTTDRNFWDNRMVKRPGMDRTASHLSPWSA